MELRLEELINKGQLWLAEPVEKAVDSSVENASKIKGFLEKFRIAQPGTNKNSIPLGVQEIDQAFPSKGLEGGAIHEFFPTAESKHALYTIPAIIAINALRRPGDAQYVIWVGRKVWPAPFIFKPVQAGNELQQRCIFSNPPNKKLTLWAIESALSSPAVSVVIAAPEKLKFATSRRLAIAAQRGNSIGILIRNPRERGEHSAAQTRWVIDYLPSPSDSPRWKLELLNCKGRQPAIKEWLVELQDEKAISLHIPSSMAGRSEAGSRRQVA